MKVLITMIFEPCISELGLKNKVCHVPFLGVTILYDINKFRKIV